MPAIPKAIKESIDSFWYNDTNKDLTAEDIKNELKEHLESYASLQQDIDHYKSYQGLTFEQLKLIPTFSERFNEHETLMEVKEVYKDLSQKSVITLYTISVLKKLLAERV